MTLYADLDAKLHHEFRSFGANVIVKAPAGALLPTDALRRAQLAGGADALVAPFGYAIAETDRGTPVVVAGTDFVAARRLDAWWGVEQWPTGEQAALLGQKAANFVADEKVVTLQYAGRAMLFAGAGRLRTGGDEG